LVINWASSQSTIVNASVWSAGRTVFRLMMNSYDAKLGFVAGQQEPSSFELRWVHHGRSYFVFVCREKDDYA
jgi:hypothetical protein